MNLEVERNYFSSDCDEQDNLDEGYNDPIGQHQDVGYNKKFAPRMSAAGRAPQTAGQPRKSQMLPHSQSNDTNNQEARDSHRYSKAEASALVDNYAYDNFG